MYIVREKQKIYLTNDEMLYAYKEISRKKEIEYIVQMLKTNNIFKDVDISSIANSPAKISIILEQYNLNIKTYKMDRAQAMQLAICYVTEPEEAPIKHNYIKEKELKKQKYIYRSKNQLKK